MSIPPSWNNLFTNLMARENLRYAVDTVEAMRRDHPDAFADLACRTGLGAEEPASWWEAAERMYLPWDERLRIHPQDDSFLNKERWEFANTPEDNYPLLLHYHPLNLYRRQVLKQADTVLAMFLLDGQFTPEAKKRNFDYYDPLTTHDSSLSVCIQSIAAWETGYGPRPLSAALEAGHITVPVTPNIVLSIPACAERGVHTWPRGFHRSAKLEAYGRAGERAVGDARPGRRSGLQETRVQCSVDLRDAAEHEKTGTVKKRSTRPVKAGAPNEHR